MSTHLSQRGDNQAERQCNLGNCRLVAISPASCTRDSDGDEQESAEELCNQHPPYVSVVCDVLHPDDFLHSWNEKRHPSINWFLMESKLSSIKHEIRHNFFDFGSAT